MKTSKGGGHIINALSITAYDIMYKQLIMKTSKRYVYMYFKLAFYITLTRVNLCIARIY